MTKTPEEKPYLQDLFDHMRNEHNLILTQSEMQEIISVVQQSLTTESVVKENLTSEQRAREYANRPNAVTRSEELAYIVAYHSRDEELAAYREALKEIVDVSEIKVTNTQTLVERMNRQKTALAKAKQLIEEKL